MVVLTVCVNYAEELKKTLPRFDNYEVLVISDKKDTATKEVVENNNQTLFTTNVFYENGASFNKGGAMAEAYELYIRDTAEWVCVFDADILMPKQWDENLNLQIGNLYGSPRYQANNIQDEYSQELQKINDPEKAMPGYFWIFHETDENIPKYPMPVFTSWQHAGNYDTVFKDRWKEENRINLDLNLVHLGVPAVNWWGRGNIKAMQEMKKNRKKYKGYKHEVII